MSQRQRILIVDDEPAVAAVLSEWLEKQGHETLVFERSYAAYEHLTTVAPDQLPAVVLVDHLLPDQLGGEFCKKVRTQSNLKSIPLVLMSGKDPGGQLSTAATDQFGCNAFFLKCSPLEQLTAVITPLLPAIVKPATIVTPRPMTVRPEVQNQGTLGAHGHDVALLFCDLHAKKFDGAVLFSHEGIERTWFLERGELVYAKTTAALEQLPALLTRKKILTPQQLKDAEVLSHGRADELFNTLVQLRLLPAAQLFEQVNEQVRLVVLSTFLWQEGTYRLMPGQVLPSPHIRLQLGFAEILAGGIEMGFDEDALHHRLESGVLQPVSGSERKNPELRLGPKQSKILHAINGSQSLEAILDSSELPALETLQTLYMGFAFGALSLS